MNKKIYIIGAVVLVVLLVLAAFLIKGGVSQKNPDTTDPQNVTTVATTGTEQTEPEDTATEGTEATQEVIPPVTLDVEAGVGTRGDVPNTDTTPETKPQPTDPSQNTKPDMQKPDSLSYEAYLAMTGDQQREFCDSFESISAFRGWLLAAKEAYDKENEAIEITGPIDLNDYTKPQG